jgi:hypothetical protein
MRHVQEELGAPAGECAVDPAAADARVARLQPLASTLLNVLRSRTVLRQWHISLLLIESFGLAARQWRVSLIAGIAHSLKRYTLARSLIAFTLLADVR